jgi:hypothetical protein
MEQQSTLDDLMSVKGFAERYPELGSEASQRWRIFCASQNGLAEAGAVVRCGRRVFIDQRRFMQWLDRQSAR